MQHCVYYVCTSIQISFTLRLIEVEPFPFRRCCYDSCGHQATLHAAGLNETAAFIEAQSVINSEGWGEGRTRVAEKALVLFMAQWAVSVGSVPPLSVALSLLLGLMSPRAVTETW